MFTIIHFGCWFEYLNLVEKICSTKLDIIIKYFFAICGFVLMISLGITQYSVDIFINLFGYAINLKWAFFLLMFFCLAAFIIQNKQINKKAKWMSFAGFIYLSLSFGFMISLRMKGANISCLNGAGITGEINISTEHFFSPFVTLPFTIIGSIWINDTMAYLVGSLIGRTHFSKASPKKTLEGTIGGIILCVISISLIAYYTNTMAVKDAAVIAACCGIFGTAGDLVESKLKRMADVKDSGSFMPGHGGFLDRFDSLLVATPFVWLYVKFFL